MRAQSRVRSTTRKRRLHRADRARTLDNAPVNIHNLVENALKFTRGRSDARIEVAAKDMKGERAFYVSDNGVGFDMRYAGKLFGAFERLHDDPAYEGLGIGLATVRRIIDRHGGRLWAESEAGRGATFYFTLPL